MIIEPKFLEPLVDKQFEILGVKIRCKDIPEDGIIQIGKAKDYWYNIYKFTEEQEKEWRSYCKEELVRYEDKYFTKLDLIYGLPLSYKKERELF